MALIWRGIFEVDEESSVRNAASYVEEWLRRKLRDEQVQLPDDGSLVEHSTGCEITGRAVYDEDLWALRAALFERRGDEELRTTVTAFHDDASSWAWVDLERWSADAFVEPWVPIAPGVVGTFLREAACRRGPSRLTHEIEVVTGEQGEAVSRQILDTDRELPVVVVSPTREERDGDRQKSAPQRSIAA